ncbi:MAG: PorT family protein [Microscillaceae bacterium]|jgi:hypothetical protein|nr:PorT family protein [Microscillaceae bacterium]
MSIKLLFKLLGIISLIAVLMVSNAQAQKRKGDFGPFRKHKPQSKKKDKNLIRFENTQWWLGAKFGGNLTQAKPFERFTPFSSTSNFNPDFYNKQYQDFRPAGAFSGFVITFFHRGFSASLQPNYRRHRFLFSNDYEWLDLSNPNLNLTLNYQYAQSLDYIDIPLLFRYDILRSKLRPFVQLGGYYGQLINANLTLERTGIDRASGSTSPISEPELEVGNPNYFIKTSLGLLGGIGVNYDVGNVRLSLEANYRYGMNNLANAQNRYLDNRLASIGYAPDNVKLRSFEISLSCLFPMRFLISKNFKSVD